MKSDNETTQQETARLNAEERQRLLNERIEAGRLRKLFSIEVLYMYKGETRKHQVTNLYRAEVRAFRETIFSEGLDLPIHFEGDRQTAWIIVPPVQLRDITITRQSNYFREYL